MTLLHREPQEVVRLLLSASANVSLYGPGHPQVQRLGDQLFELLSQLLESSPELSLMLIENEVVIDGRPQEPSLFLGRFAQVLKSRGIEHLRLARGISRGEIDALVESLAGARAGEFCASDHIAFGKLELRLEEGQRVAGTGEVAEASEGLLPELSEQELEQFTEIYRAVKRHQKLKLGGISEIVTNLVDAFRQEGLPLLVLATLRENDEYTFTHSTNVCILNLAQAATLGIQGQQLKDIGIAAMLHDIGKLFIPEEIISKRGPLTEEEFDLMRQHPVKGARYLIEQPGVPRMAAVAAFEHHARYNLSGYPALAPDWRLNLCSHLTMISDFFDATRTRRSYREPLSVSQIMDMMRAMAGQELHPVLTRNFLNLLQSLTAGGSASEVA